MTYQVILVHNFERELAKLARKYPSSINIVGYLFDEIEQGKLIGDDITGLKLKGNKVFKVRLRNPDANKGLSGGFRLIYYLLTSDSEVYPLAIYSKNDQEDISSKEIMRLIRKYVD